MGFDLNSVKFLLWSKNLGVSFERTLTLGHQGLGCSRGGLRRELANFGIPAGEGELAKCFERAPFTPLFADQFLGVLGAKEVVSVDRSDFEGATLLHDLNHPFPEHLRGTFDLVIDGGTLEHIYDYPRALANCLDLLRVGGHFVSFAPAAGQMGHGFYQLSPELFFRVFGRERGYSLRKIVLYECAKSDSYFYEVKDPALTGMRSVSPARPMQLAVLAQKISGDPSISSPPQQSDYVAIWEREERQKTGPKAEAGKSHSRFQRLRLAANPYWPSWLRDFRDACKSRWNWRRGLAQMQHLRHFPRLRNQEIHKERAGGQ